MRPEEFWHHITDGPLASLYLFYGAETFLLDRAVTTVRRRICGESPRPQGLWLFRSGEDQVARATEVLATPPLLAPRQLVILRDAEKLSEADQSFLTKKIRDQEHWTGSLVVVAGSADLRKKLFAQCAERGMAVEFRRLSPYQLPSWVGREARELGHTIGGEAVNLLIELVGSDLGALHQELEKLSLYAGEAQPLTLNHVAQVVGDIKTFSVFALSEAVGRKDRRATVQILHKVLAEGEKPFALVGLLAAQLRRLWQAAELRARGQSEKEIGTALHVWGSRLDMLLRQVSLFRQAELRRGLLEAAALDQALKSGRGNPRLLLENFLLSLCG